MTIRTARNEDANAEILGVVILIGILAITAGIISATTLASPQPVKVPAASIEITSDSTMVYFSHLGGDAVPVSQLKVVVHRVDAAGISLPPSSHPGSWLSASDLSNGLVISKDRAALGAAEDDQQIAISLVWSGNGGESVIALWDPSGILGSLGFPGPYGGTVPSPVPTPLVTPPTVAPNTDYDDALQGLDADFSLSEGPYYPGTPIQFSGFLKDTCTGTATDWLWNFGDLHTSNAQTGENIYSHDGTYSVSLTVSNSVTGARDTVVKTVEVLPVTDGARFYFSVSPEEGGRTLPVICSDPAEGEYDIGQTIWQWTFTDGLTGVVEKTQKLTEAEGGRSYPHTFENTLGTLDNICTIGLTAWSPYLSDPIIFEPVTVTVHPPLQAEFSTNLTDGWSGIGPTVMFTDTSIGTPESWAWDFGNGTTSTEQSPSHTFPLDADEPSSFTVKLTVNGWGQTSTVEHVITLWPPVIASFTASPTAVEVQIPVTFTDQSTGGVTRWLWNFGDGSSATDQNPVHLFSSPGKYDVTLYVERATGVHSADQKTIPVFISVGPEVMAGFTVNPEPAEGVETLTTFTFKDTSTSTDEITAPVNYWSWDFGDSSPIIEGNDPAIHRYPSHVYATAGTYTVTLTAQNAYRQDTATHDVTVHPKVTASFSSDVTAVPVNGIITFTDTSQSDDPINYWRWDFGDGSPIFEGSNPDVYKNPVHTYTSKDIYSVSLTANNSYHTATAIGTVTVFDPVTAAINPIPTGGPVGMTVTFNDASTGDVNAWSWDFNGDGAEDSNLQSPMATYPDPGDYTVTLTAWNDLRSDLPKSTATATVRVYGSLTASFDAVQLEEPATSAVAFTDTSTGNPYTWSWDFGDGSEIFEGSDPAVYKNPTHPYTEAGPYTVTLKVVNPAGPSTTTQAITIT